MKKINNPLPITVKKNKVPPVEQRIDDGLKTTNASFEIDHNMATFAFYKIVKSQKKYVIILPNNDIGSDIIIKKYDSLSANVNFRILPSLRFEFYLTLLKNAELIIGNSSAGIREAPVFGVPTINIGTRQNNRYFKLTP